LERVIDRSDVTNTMIYKLAIRVNMMIASFIIVIKVAMIRDKNNNEKESLDKNIGVKVTAISEKEIYNKDTVSGIMESLRKSTWNRQKLLSILSQASQSEQDRQIRIDDIARRTNLKVVRVKISYAYRGGPVGAVLTSVSTGLGVRPGICAPGTPP
jgi:hypothetical protein